MSERSFYEPSAKQNAKAAVQAIEAQTSAEIVVTLRWASGSYRDADVLFGAAFALGILVLMLFVEHEFSLGAFPLQTALAFAVGALICAKVPLIRRLLVSQARMAGQVHAYARAAFVDQGVSRTKGRTGILVYVAMFERRVEVVTDIGVDPVRLGAPFEEAKAALQASMNRGPDLSRFLVALRSLGPALAVALPPMADDENELPDDVEAD